jgi:hypothetical protein
MNNFPYYRETFHGSTGRIFHGSTGNVSRTRIHGGRKSADFALDLGFTPHPRFHGYAEPFLLTVHWYTIYKTVQLQR